MATDYEEANQPTSGKYWTKLNAKKWVAKEENWGWRFFEEEEKVNKKRTRQKRS
ncbi:hypothetical protein AVEN_262020-1, partial [Araneus ventricosus]